MKRLWLLFAVTALLVSSLVVAVPKPTFAAGASGCGPNRDADDTCYVLLVKLTGNVPTSGVTVTAKRHAPLSGYKDNSFTLYGQGDKTPCMAESGTKAAQDWTCSSSLGRDNYTSYYGVDQVNSQGGACANPAGQANATTSNSDVVTFTVTANLNGQSIGSSDVNLCNGSNQGGAWITSVSIGVVNSPGDQQKGGIHGHTSYANPSNGGAGPCTTRSFLLVTGGPDKLVVDSNRFQVSPDSNGDYDTQLKLTPGGGYTVALTCYDGPETTPYTATKDNITVPKGDSVLVDFTNVLPGNAGGGEAANGVCDDGSAKDWQGNCTSTEVVDCGGEAFNWIICPAVKLAIKGANLLDGFIMDQLDIDVTTIFDNTGQKGTAQSGYYEAWSQFRIIATSLLVIGGLAMVLSTALGFEFLDAYTIRKTLPRLIIAIIGISLSWPLMRLCVDFFDSLGFGLRAIMYAPFKDMGGTISVGTGILTTAVVAGGLFITPAGWTLVFTALLAAFVGFLILIIRQAALIMLIILAPVAIAAYILPNTQKVWKLWSDNFFGLLLMFPIISGLIAAGHIFAAVTINANPGNSPKSIIAQGIALVAYFGVLFLLPLAARLATGLIGNLAGFVNDRHKGAFDRLKGVREKSRQQTHARRMAGQGWVGSGRTGSLYRRGALIGTPGSGALNPTRGGRNRFNQMEIALRQKQVEEAMKNDNGRAAGDDIANEIAQKAGTNSRNFQQQYYNKLYENAVDEAARTGKPLKFDAATARKQAAAAQGLLETGYGANMGSDAMRLAAFKAQQMSVTGYGNTDGELERRFSDAHRMVKDGLMTASDAMATMKQNKGRIEASGISFGTGMGAIESGQINARDLMKTTLEGLTPSSVIGARKEGMQMVSRHLKMQLDDAVSDAGGDISHPEVQKVMGTIAGVRDTINSQAPQLADIFAKNVMSQSVGSGGLTVRQYEEQLRTAPDSMAPDVSTFHDKRKEWTSQAAQQQQQQQQTTPKP